MSNKKNILINKIDVSYRSIEDLDNQYNVMFNILNLFDEKKLKEILKYTNKVKKNQHKQRGQ
jgi:hypothetical protein|tara:strand:- start:224 stop:409 length:186 start_codon:yes stop_codon:yes gene_type:complete